MEKLLATMDGLLFAGEGAPAQPAAGGGSLFDFLLPMALIGIVFYFFLVRPEKKRRSEAAQFQRELKKNDRIVTIGGIVGVVVNAPKDSEEVTIRIDENNNTRMHILRSSVSRHLDESSGDDGKTNKEAE